LLLTGQESVFFIVFCIKEHFYKKPVFALDKIKVWVYNRGVRIEIQRKHPQQAIQQIIDHLEAVEKKYQELLPEIEQDAIIVAKLIEQKCRGLRDPIETASQWIKKTP